MHVSTLDLFRPGPGPSSTYTGVPQRAALRFVHALAADGLLPEVAHVEAQLHGAFAFLGREHATHEAIVAGLAGTAPEGCNRDALLRCDAQARREHVVALGGRHRVRFDPERDIRRAVSATLAGDGSAVRFVARDVTGAEVAVRTYFAGGGGMVIAAEDGAPPLPRRVPYPYASAAELVEVCASRGKRIADVARANESAATSPGELVARLTHAGLAMRASVERGLVTQGMLPHGRPRGAQDALHAAARAHSDTAHCAAYATAVGEENASGGTIVAAPSAGAAGPVAALLYHWQGGRPLHAQERTIDFLLAAGAVGGLLRTAGLIQAGCQGEIGVAAAMAAAGFATVHEASAAQVLHAAERALEPHLGLACDLAGGRIGDPCIERGARAAALAHDAALVALRMPHPRVALDMLARAMVASGRTLATRAKATSLGGFGRNVVEC